VMPFALIATAMVTQTAAKRPAVIGRDILASKRIRIEAAAAGRGAGSAQPRPLVRFPPRRELECPSLADYPT
jgi:hypothetical protein